MESDPQPLTITNKVVYLNPAKKKKPITNHIKLIASTCKVGTYVQSADKA